jgi:hypothetical protein
MKTNYKHIILLLAMVGYFFAGCGPDDEPGGCIFNVSVWIPTDASGKKYLFAVTNVTSGHPEFLPYTYLWETGDTTPFLYPTASGYYNVTVTDATGCRESNGENYALPAPKSVVVDSVKVTAWKVDPYIGGLWDAGNFPDVRLSINEGSTQHRVQFLSAQTFMDQPYPPITFAVGDTFAIGITYIVSAWDENNPNDPNDENDPQWIEGFTFSFGNNPNYPDSLYQEAVGRLTCTFYLKWLY